MLETAGGMGRLVLEIKGDVGRPGQRDAEKVRVGRPVEVGLNDANSIKETQARSALESPMENPPPNRRSDAEYPTPSCRAPDLLVDSRERRRRLIAEAG